MIQETRVTDLHADEGTNTRTPAQYGGHSTDEFSPETQPDTSDPSQAIIGASQPAEAAQSDTATKSEQQEYNCTYEDCHDSFKQKSQFKYKIPSFTSIIQSC
jgi:hypothetical protein